MAFFLGAHLFAASGKSSDQKEVPRYYAAVDDKLLKQDFAYFLPDTTWWGRLKQYFFMKLFFFERYHRLKLKKPDNVYYIVDEDNNTELWNIQSSEGYTFTHIAISENQHYLALIFRSNNKKTYVLTIYSLSKPSLEKELPEPRLKKAVVYYSNSDSGARKSQILYLYVDNQGKAACFVYVQRGGAAWLYRFDETGIDPEKSDGYTHFFEISHNGLAIGFYIGDKENPIGIWQGTRKDSTKDFTQKGSIVWLAAGKKGDCLLPAGGGTKQPGRAAHHSKSGNSRI